MRRSEILITALIAFPFLTVVLGTVGFAVGIPVQGWYSSAAFLVALGSVVWLARDKRASCILTYVGIVVTALFVASTQMMLLGGDGQAYQYPAIYLLGHGWNPLTTT